MRLGHLTGRIIGLVFLLISGGVAWSATPPETVHIYIDLASTPALLQMVDAVSQPAHEPKLFMWKRFFALAPDDPILTSLNAEWADAKFLGEHNYDKFIAFSDTAVQTFYHKHPDARYIVHLNLSAYPWSGHVFDIIPPAQIATVHLYEDSAARTLWDPISWQVYDAFVRTYGPALAHVAFYDDLVQIAPNNIVRYDFQDLATRLSPHQKRMILHLAGLTDAFLKQTTDITTALVFIDDPILKQSEATDFLEHTNRTIPLKDLTCLYKSHPRTPAPGENLNLLRQYCGRVVVIPNAVPLEALLFSDIPIRYVTGYGSSIFFSFRADQILGYIARRGYEPYISVLKHLGLLTSDRIYRLPPDATSPDT